MFVFSTIHSTYWLGTLSAFTSCNDCQSIHYAIIDLNGDTCCIHSISMNVYSRCSQERRKGENVRLKNSYYGERSHLAGQLVNPKFHACHSPRRYINPHQAKGHWEVSTVWVSMLVFLRGLSPSSGFCSPCDWSLWPR